MKIAIYHNLNSGGALHHLSKFVENAKQENVIDIYTLNDKIKIKTSGKNFSFKLKKTNNIFEHLMQVMFELPKVDKLISKEINNKTYDMVLIFPCHLVQSPHILRYLDYTNTVVFYMFEESKREFYENTSFNYYSIKSKLSRLIRLPVKFIDIFNCKKTKNIIVNSNYSLSTLKNIYNKEGYVVYIGLKKVKPRKIIINNNKKILTTGILTKLKGYEFTLKQVRGIAKEITIIGHKTHESKYILQMGKRMGVKMNFIVTNDEKEKNKIINEHSIFLANYIYEPFGIATLEAVDKNRIVLGLNQAGTREIIDNNKNGFLYPQKILAARKMLKSILKRDKITLVRTSELDWSYMTNNILSLYHKLKNTPNE